MRHPIGGQVPTTPLEVAALRATLAAAAYDVWRMSDEEVIEAFTSRRSASVPVALPAPDLSLEALLAALAAAALTEQTTLGDSPPPTSIDLAVSAQSGINPATSALGNATSSLAIPPPGETPQENWVEIELVDKNGHPLSYEEYRLELSTGKTVEGQLDSTGKIRVDESGLTSARVSFPKLNWHLV